jgi:hypothetical protein
MQQNVAEIPSNREMPKRIREAKEKRNLAIFLGAGFPRMFGCWGWDQLAKGFLEKCRLINLINAREKAEYWKLLNDKEQIALNVITFCYKKLVGNGFQNEIETLLQESCQANQNSIDVMKDAYAQLFRLGDYFVTTNYDGHFDNFFTSNLIFYQASDYFNVDWSGRALDKNALYHIHGSVKDATSIVLTYDHYTERETNPNYMSFLKNLFCNYSVLFVGSSVEAYLNPILRAVKKQGNCSRSYLLKHYFSNQQDEYNLEQSTFDAHNIDLISFLGDENEFLELISVIKSWNNQIGEMGLELK